MGDRSMANRGEKSEVKSRTQMIKQISRAQFHDGLCRSPSSDTYGPKDQWNSAAEQELWCGREGEWYSAYNDTVYGVVIQDQVDRVWSYFILKKTPPTESEFRTDYLYKDAARAALLQVLEDTYDPEPEADFELPH
jgi:hypothetical protein